jgi:hypothetical protein
LNNFDLVINAAQSKLDVAHSIGSGTLVLVDGSFFGSPTLNNPLRVSAGNCIFSITSRSGNTLTIGSMLEGTVDAALNKNTVVRANMTAGHFQALQTAINQRAHLGNINDTPSASSVGMPLRSVINQTADFMQFSLYNNVVIAGLGATGTIYTYLNNAATKGLVIRAFGAHTANLIELQNSTTAVLTKFDNSGQLYVNGNVYCGNRLYISRSDQSGVPAIFPAYVSYDTSNTLNFYAHTGGYAPINISAAGIYAQSATQTVLIVQGAAGQTANLAEYQGFTGSIYGSISENGYFTTRKNSAPADAELANSEAAFWFDSTPGAAKFMIKAKNSSGAVVTGSINLA